MSAPRPGDLVLSEAGAGEAGEVAALVQSAYRGAASRQGWTTEAHLLEGQRTDEAAVAGLIAEEGSLLLTARREGALVGCCQLSRRPDRGAYFGMFAVSPLLQGQGTGTGLLAEAERIAREEWGARWMRMTVISHREELIAYYRRRGYLPTGETEPFPYGDDRSGLPLRDDLVFVVLEKRLT